jgi:hypothetical protein
MKSTLGRAINRQSGVVATIGAILALILAAPIAAAATPNPGIIAPNDALGQTGKTYGEWSAAWWQYVFSFTNPTSPFADTSGARCGVDQSGPVFFLVGTFTTSVDPTGVVLASATRRHCTVPAGTTLFFPVINNECSSVEPPPFGPFTDRKDLAACNHQFLDTATDLRAEIDGAPVQGLQDFRICQTRLCFNSPIFNVVLPAHNILGVPAGPATSMSDGYYLLVRPLPAGEHVVHFHGFLPAANFALDVTYAPLTVK